MRLIRILVIWPLAVAWCAAPRLEAAETDFFESKIRPVLIRHCYECHSDGADVIQAGLRVDDSGAMQRGGDSGEAILPGEPDNSLLIAAIRYDGMEMPPDQKLPDDVVRDFETWVRRGAVMPPPENPENAIHETIDQATIDWSSARRHWSFRSPEPHAAPTDVGPDSGATDWSTRKADRFVSAKLGEAGLSPNPRADKRTWLRRVTYDLTGLPPTPEEVRLFVADHRPLAQRRVVERLLSTAAYGEHWARVWMDVARYAEDQAHIVGNNDSLTYPNAYLYRDWVIAALAADMPYDEFVRQQLAADLLNPDAPDSHVALGFLGLGPKYYRRGDLEVMADEWEDRVDVVTRGLLGLTVACARCHDHKYDPIPTSDYYALAGVFASTEMFNRPIDASVETQNGQAKKPQDAVHILREGDATTLHVMIRGDVNRLGPVAPRGFLTVLEPAPGDDEDDDFMNGSGRLALADRIACRDNPLTARVIVNRVWGRLMGRPLVDTPSNFGLLGSEPTHPRLLDDLSVRFMQAGWSLKWLMREITLSSTYGQSSDVDAVKLAADPENRLLWRMPRRRLSIEAYRDAILAVTGRLDSATFGPSISPQDPTARRRTVYSKVSRLDLNPMLARFDFPDPNAHSASRHETTTPLQKLFLLNSPFMLRHAEAFASRIHGSGRQVQEAVRLGYRLAFARDPTPEEQVMAERFLLGGDDRQWTQFAQALFISNEMFVVD